MAGTGINPVCLREYDIRGTVGKTLFPEDGFLVGRAFGTVVIRNGGKNIVVGGDGRLSTPELLKNVISGLKSCGLEVILIGLSTTPMLYFAAFETDAHAALMVTGSHNPAEDNGFKLLLQKKPFYGRQIVELGRLMQEKDFCPESPGTLKEVDLREAYLTKLLTGLQGRNPALKVVWDCGNGASGPLVKELLTRLSGTHILLNERPDGTFPAHHPDPTVPANLQQLIEAVKEHKADLGIAFDGDADRIGLTDHQGNILFGDKILLLLAKSLLKKHPGAAIIADVKASQVLFDEVAKSGGRPVMWKTGHSLIKAKMAETEALLAGEMSGHIFYADDWYGFDDAVYVALRFLRMLDEEQQPLSALTAQIPEVVNTPELRFPCPDEQKFMVVQKVEKYLSESGKKIDTTDGVRVSDPHGWWLLRASNTQAVLVARAEAGTLPELDRLKKELTQVLGQAGIQAPVFA